MDLSHRQGEDLVELGRVIRARVLQFTGIPVSIGIAPTKVLAKIAAEIVKKDPAYAGVLDLHRLTGQDIDPYLEAIEVGDVWGIGRKYALFLSNYGIDTARDLKYCDAQWARRHLTVVGERIVLELRGISCMPLEVEAKSKQGIMCSKTFGREVTEYEQMMEVVANYTARAAEKLRSQETLASSLSVFVQTSRFNQQEEHYSNSFALRIPYPTAYTPDLVVYALQCLKAIYRPGHRYKKAGVFLSKIVPEESVQPDLFGEFSLSRHYQQVRLMYIVDAINRVYGRDTLFFAVQGVVRPWRMRQSQLSGRYTTQWSEILRAK